MAIITMAAKVRVTARANAHLSLSAGLVMESVACGHLL